MPQQVLFEADGQTHIVWVDPPARVQLNSHAFFCSTCGNVWGRIYIVGGPWEIHSRPCRSHGKVFVYDDAEVPGSMCAHFEHAEELALQHRLASWEAMPNAVLGREFTLWFKAMTKERP